MPAENLLPSALPCILAHGPTPLELMAAILFPVALVAGAVRTPLILLYPAMFCKTELPPMPPTEQQQRRRRVLKALLLNLATFLYCLGVAWYLRGEDDLSGLINTAFIYLGYEALSFLLRWRWCKRQASAPSSRPPSPNL